MSWLPRCPNCCGPPEPLWTFPDRRGSCCHLQSHHGPLCRRTSCCAPPEAPWISTFRRVPPPSAVDLSRRLGPHPSAAELEAPWIYRVTVDFFLHGITC